MGGTCMPAEGIGLKAYTTDNETTPPQEIVDLFNELQKIPMPGKLTQTGKMSALVSAMTRSQDWAFSRQPSLPL
jgi:hypothetical protein